MKERMATEHPLPESISPPAAQLPLVRALEQEELVYFPACPFLLPEGRDRDFLFEQRLGGRAHKNISYDPTSERLTGYRRHSPEQGRQLRRILGDFGNRAAAWLAQELPGYASGWRRDRVSFRPEEEATRRLRQTARNDLLHIDSFPSRPSGGWRILRLFVNINHIDPRVWVTSESFGILLARYGRSIGLPSVTGQSLTSRVGQGLLGIFDAGRRRRTVYDGFMRRFHDFLKTNDEFQERASRRFWKFPPGSAWLLFADSLSHAVLRGRFALEHSFFIPPHSLLKPETSPAALLERACGQAVRRLAA
jgi:hypothetical protein